MKSILRTIGTLALCRLLVDGGLASDGQNLDAVTRDFNLAAVRRDLAVNSNDPETVAGELVQPATIRTIGKSCGLSERDITALRAVRKSGPTRVLLTDERGKSGQFDAFCEKVSWYVKERANGHTSGFLLACFGPHSRTNLCLEQSLAVLVRRCPIFPAESFRKCDSGWSTNKPGAEISSGVIMTFDGSVFRTTMYTNYRATEQLDCWTTYVLDDGEVSWLYQVTGSDPSGTEVINSMRIDPKEYDARYHELIRRVESEVVSELRAQGRYAGQAGAQYYRLKQRRLKSYGVDWRTPLELNPEDHCDPFSVHSSDAGGLR